MKKILIMGLPGAGKTTLAKLLAKRLNAVHFNADDVRTNINKDLGFSEADRIEHAHRMGWLCDKVIETGNYAIADFICPTEQTRYAFWGPTDGMIVWCDRIAESRFEDTNRMFEPPEYWDVRVFGDNPPDYWVERIVMQLRPVFDPLKPTALFVGRYQPFHDGHKALIVRGIERCGQACIAVRSMPVGEANPHSFQYIHARIESAMRDYDGRFVVVSVPNVTAILYGRDVGYAVERVDLDEATRTISATMQRAKENGPLRGEDGVSIMP